MASNRREFLKVAGLACAAVGCRHVAGKQPGGAPAGTSGATVPKRPLGNTGASVSILGIGGAHISRAESLDEAKRMVDEALDRGVSFVDTAWEYSDGRSEEWLGEALRGKRDRAFLMTKVCTHGRDRRVAMQQLEESLRRLQTDRLDLWQIHECIYDDDPDRHFAPDGVVRALEDAKRAGKVRFVGFTGHKHPRIHRRMLSMGFRFDAMQMPLGVLDATYASFEQEILPIALREGIGVIGMKSLSGAGEPVNRGIVTAAEALRYAMSIPGVAVTVSGMDTPEILRHNIDLAAGLVPFSAAEMAAIREKYRAVAQDGELEPYKSSQRYDSRLGRSQPGRG